MFVCGGEALKLCVEVFLKEWDRLKDVPKTPQAGQPYQRREAEKLIHTTKGHTAPYPEFDQRFPDMPSYTRRAIIADALGKVSSYLSNHENWEQRPAQERGAEPTLGFPSYYELTFYEQDRDTTRLSEGVIHLRLYNGTAWGWYSFLISSSDAARISRLSGTRKMLSPVVEKVRGWYRVRFSFEESRTLAKDVPLDYTVLAVDLGVNAPASWCVMTADGTVHAKGVIHLACEEGRLRRAMNRKRMYQQAGKKSKCVYRWVTDANRALSIETVKKLMDIAVLCSVDCIVFEGLDLSGCEKGRDKERLHMWRARDVQRRVELQAHRHGIRISRVCAWGTSRLAFDGSGKTDRRRVYHWERGVRRYNYSLCAFQNSKVYNCDLSAAQNIGARYFLRAYAKREKELPLPSTPKRTLDTLLLLVYNGLPSVA